MGCFSIMSWVWGLDRGNVIFFSSAILLSELVIDFEYTCEIIGIRNRREDDEGLGTPNYGGGECICKILRCKAILTARGNCRVITGVWQGEEDLTNGTRQTPYFLYRTTFFQEVLHNDGSLGQMIHGSFK
jgi:hypothetical protein